MVKKDVSGRLTVCSWKVFFKELNLLRRLIKWPKSSFSLNYKGYWELVLRIWAVYWPFASHNLKAKSGKIFLNLRASKECKVILIMLSHIPVLFALWFQILYLLLKFTALLIVPYNLYLLITFLFENNCSI